MTKLVLPLICFVFLSLLLAGSVWADEYYFQEEFNINRPKNTLDLDKWIVYPNDSNNVGTTWELNDKLTLFQLNRTQRFPYIVSKNQIFPNGNFSAEIKFQYNKITFWGTGIALVDQLPQNGDVGPSGLLTIAVWQDKSVGPNMRIHFDGPMVYTSPINTNPHTLKVERINQKYQIYLDNQLVYTSPITTEQVKYLWMGNHTIQNPSVPEWTQFTVDYIRVTQLAPSKTPLILIPGIGGSELKVAEDTNWSKDNGHGGIFSNNYLAGEKVWVNELEAAKPGDDDYFDVLKMKPDGVTPEAKLELTGELIFRVYGDLINFFIANGYTTNQNLFVFPYDWRKDISHTAPLLNQKVQEIKQQTGAQKVDIVAHSMGGLVSRYYISDPQRATDIRKLFTLGTPHVGAPEFLKTLQYGDCLAVEVGSLCLSVNPLQVRDTVQNSIGGFELAPSKSYFNFYSGENYQYSYPYKKDDKTLNYIQIKDLLATLNYNTALFTPAESFHETDNSLRNINGVDVTLIAGSGLPTLGQIIETTHTSLLGIKSIKKDALNINGDKTVPLFSAALNDPSRSLSFLGDAKVFYTNQDHGELVSPGPALELVKNIINNNNNLPSGVSTDAYKFSGTQVSVHSPVNIHVYDSNNNHTGLTNNGEFETNIPGSSYNTLDDAKFIFLPQDGTYTIKFEATDNGSFDFKIRTYENDINSKLVLYKDIPLTSLTKGQTTLNTFSTESPVIQIDTNGDGVADSNISYTLPESSDNQETTQITSSDTSNTSSSTSNNSSGSTSQDNTSSNTNNISTDNSQITTPAVLGINFTNQNPRHLGEEALKDIQKSMLDQLPDIQSTPLKNMAAVLATILTIASAGLVITFVRHNHK